MNAEKTGGFIRELRKEQGLTQQQFADRINVSDKAVSRWETGRGFPDIGYLEDIASALGVSVPEILRGERFAGQITESDVKEVSSAGISAAKSFVSRKKWTNLLTGFVAGLIVLALLFVHLTGQIPLDYTEKVISIRELSEEGIVAVLGEEVAGYELEEIKEPEGEDKLLSISCYDTLWHRIFGRKIKTVAFLGTGEELDYVYYYPSDGGDELLWKNASAKEMSGGVQTLPRLIYNYWILIGLCFSLLGIVLYLVFRKKRFGSLLLKIAMIPVCFTLSTVAVLAGRYGTVYSAPYYLSGILLLAGLLYALFLLVYGAVRNRKREKA